ncbi:MAG: hypothetical protein QNJ36_12855 [Calothrix sp. MO_167.B42]|nr:hypothetical protein [Calothrix sp. MO_167.B42]
MLTGIALKQNFAIGFGDRSLGGFFPWQVLLTSLIFFYPCDLIWNRYGGESKKLLNKKWISISNAVTIDKHKFGGIAKW